MPTCSAWRPSGSSLLSLGSKVFRVLDMKDRLLALPGGRTKPRKEA